MKSKKIVAGVLTVLALGIASPAMSQLGLPTIETGITAYAAEEHVFTGEIKKIISVGILVTPSADSAEAAQASQFMVKYSDTDAFNVGDTVTVTYSDEVSIEKDVGTVTATKVEVGANAAAPANDSTTTTAASETEKTTESANNATTTTAAVVDNKPASTTPETGEGSAMIAVAGVTVVAAVLSKKFSLK